LSLNFDLVNQAMSRVVQVLIPVHPDAVVLTHAVTIVPFFLRKRGLSLRMQEGAGRLRALSGE
jgi:hypothetical protein